MKGALEISLLFLLLFTFSCGKKDSSTLPPVRQEQHAIGIFKTTLKPSNEGISPANGTSQVRIQQDIFHARVYVKAADYVDHAQHIHSGTRCPTISDDKNKDGIIDAEEAEAVYGPVLFTIDDQ